MTHVAEPPVAEGSDATRLEQVNHWINGARVAGTSRRQGPVYKKSAPCLPGAGSGSAKALAREAAT